MTEGIAGALLAVAAWLALPEPAGAAPALAGGGGVAARSGLSPGALGRPVAAGLVLGVAVLVRPQVVLALPALALVCSGPRLRGFVLALGLVGITAAGVCAPWIARNCERMKACTLSANAGWNLYIGAAEGATGSWVSVEALGIPPACRTVWDEAEKDRCFGREAVGVILRDPLRWASLVPAKLSVTFDYAGAAGWYLMASNHEAFGEEEKVVLGVVETLWQRLVVLAAILAVARGGATRQARVALASPALLLLSPWAFAAHLGLLAGMAASWRRTLSSPAALVAAGVLLSTIVSHAVFFGAGRYSLVCFPALSALAGTLLTRGSGDTGEAKEQ
jgi:hypothetical protein